MRFIKSYMLGSHIYYKNSVSAWQISSYDKQLYLFFHSQITQLVFVGVYLNY